MQGFAGIWRHQVGVGGITRSICVHEGDRLLRLSRPVMSMVDETRISRLNDNDVRRDGKYVLYWMQESVRSRYNHALEYAVERANEVKAPLLAVYGLTNHSRRRMRGTRPSS
mmetsp:Transcript_15957/g.23292  ORF Transcript_15957/g.23292 Transcript_15957/m.23292 type:complete len:112 (-) Transcript_15957:39-374(-)